MMGSRKPRALLVAGLLLAAASCSTKTAQLGGGAPAGYTKIDDMEGDGFPFTPPAGLTTGGWFTATDCSANGNIWPPPVTVTDGVLTLSMWEPSTLPSPHETFPGVMSTRAARLRTTAPLSGIWGASMGLAFALEPDLSVEIVPIGGTDAGTGGHTGCPIILGAQGSVDLSAFSGITFWAKADSTGERTMLVIFTDSHTDQRGGVCNYVDSNSPNFCYNGFSTTIALSDTFTRYTVDFETLKQIPNWGYHPNPDVFDVQHVYQLNFQMNVPTCYANEMCVGGAPPPVTFDVWIDDLYFVNKAVGGE